MLPVEHATAKARLRVLLSTGARGSVWNGRCCSGDSLGHRVLSFDRILWALASHGEIFIGDQTSSYAQLTLAAAQDGMGMGEIGPQPLVTPGRKVPGACPRRLVQCVIGTQILVKEFVERMK